MGPRSRKLLAVLAGGVVLAGGGVTTLAAWQDDAYERAPLTLSSFHLLQNTGSGWGEVAPESAPGSLNLTVTTGTNLALVPGGSVNGWVALRVAAGSLGATVTMNGATTAGATPGLLDALSYQAFSGVSQADCRTDSTGGGTRLVAADSALSTAASAPIVLPAGTDPSALGAEVGVCLKLTLRSGISTSLGGRAVTPVWRFSAQSAG